MKLEKIIAVGNDRTVYKDGDLCIKVFNEDYSKAEVLSEALNQALVEETGLNIPKIHEVAMIEGKWAIVSDYIKGKMLSQLMEEDPCKKPEYLAQFIDLQLEIHSKTCPDWNGLYTQTGKEIDKTDLEEYLRYNLHTRLSGLPRGNKLCHGYFNPTNVIIGEDGKAYILDWVHATQGNPLADAAKTYLLFWLRGDINGATRYLDGFCQKSNAQMQDIQRWMPVVAASQTLEGNEKEREFLHSWIRVFDYQ